MIQYIIEAVVQPAKHSPYMKVAYISSNPNVDYHMETILQKEYYQVASVKSEPASQRTLHELRYDMQGNMSIIDDVAVVAEGDANEHVIPSSDPSKDD